VLTQHKLRELKDVIENFNREIALNPTSSASIQGQLSRMLEAIAVLTDADKVRAIIREGESKRIEFKESLSLDVKKQKEESYDVKKEPKIEQSSLKTIVAFLNTEGGTLLIGVSDDCQVCGVDGEIEKFHKTTDKFLLHFKNLLQSKIGEQFYPFIDNRLVKVDDVNVLLVECKASQTPCFLEGKNFYVRTNPATDQLEGHKLVEYVKHHFRS
jgi:predicted HTH transcriptional regulator